MVVAIVIVIGAVGVGFRMVDARANLLAAESKLSLVSGLVRGGTGLRQSSSRAEVIAILRSAHAKFAAARNDLAIPGPVLDHLGWVPGIGSQLVAAYPLADAGSEATQASLDLFSGLHTVWPVVDAGQKDSSMLSRLAPALLNGRSEFGRAQSLLDSASSALDKLPSDLGNTGIDRKVRRARVLLTGLRHVAQWLTLAPSLLGARSPSHFLLVWENPDELRATGGFIPAANYITVSNGRIHTDPFGSALPHEITFPVPLPESVYTYEGSWLLRDSSWSPDFPLTARYERWLFGEDTSLWAPFVIDVTGATQILRAVGPLYIRQTRSLVTPANVARLIEFFHHHNSKNVTDTKSQRFLSFLADAVLRRIETLGLSGIVKLGTGLHAAIQRQEILLYDRSSNIESAIQGVGADGSVVNPRNDSLFVVDDNRSYNKINPYVSETAGYTVSIRRSGSVTANLSLRYHLAATPPSLLGQGPFWGTRGSKHDYQDFIRVLVPPGAKLLSELGLDKWAPQPAYGLTELAGRIQLVPNETHIVRFRYALPSAIFSAGGGQSYALTIQAQPGADLHHYQIGVHVGPGMSVGPAGGSTWQSSVEINTPTLTIRVPISPTLGGLNKPLINPPWTADPYMGSEYFTDKQHPF